MAILSDAASMDDWLFSPPLQLTGGTSYQVTFYYREGPYSCCTERLEVQWGTAPAVAGMTGGQIWNNAGFNNGVYVQGVATLAPATSGAYYIGWHGYSAAAQAGILVDDITIQNPNYGNGGEYNFANSTPGAAGAPYGQPIFNWITERTNVVTTWTSGDANDGYVTVDLSPYLGGGGFPFFGASYTTLYIGSNGLVTFGGPPPTTSYGGDTLPDPAAPNNLIAGAWMNLDLRTSLNAEAALYYGGDASRFVVTYWHARRFSGAASPNYVTFQIILYPNGRIVTQYNEAESSGTTAGSPSIQSDALIGLENSDGTQGLPYRVNGAGGPMFGSDLALAMAPAGIPTAVRLAFLGASAQAPAAVPMAALAVVLLLGGLVITHRRNRSQP